MPAIGDEAGRSTKAPARKKKYLPPRPAQGSPTGDSPTTRAGDFAAANGYKRTQAYRKTVRDVYKAQPVKDRRAIARGVAKNAATRPTVTADDRDALAVYRALSASRRAAVDRAQRALAVKRLGQRSVATTIDRVHEQRHDTDVQQLKDLGYLARARYGDTPKVMPINRMPSKVVDTKLAKSLGWTPAQLKKNADLVSSDPHALGFKEAGVVDKLFKVPAQTLASAGALAEATYHDPLGVPKKTALQGIAAVPAAFGAAAQLVQHPVGQTKKLAKAYLARTGEKYDEKVKRIRKEGGFADAADVATLVFPAGGPAGDAVKELLLKRTARAGVRVSGDLVKPRREGGVVKTYTGTIKDSMQGRKLAKELAEAEAGGKPMDAVRHAAAVANRKAGETVEVVPKRAAAKQAHDVAMQKGKAVYGLKADQGERVAAATKTIHTLNKDEKRALYYATVYGIRTADQARELLPTLVDKIAAKRAEHGVRVTGSLKKSDMLPDLEKILAAPEKHFTEKLDGVVEALRADSIRAGREDPSLPNAATRVGRRYAPLADLLGIHKGEGVDTPGLLFHGSATRPETLLKEGLRPGTPELSNGVPDKHGVYLTSDPATARFYGRHIYAVDKSKLPNAVPDEHGGVGAMFTPDSVPADALRYIGRGDDWNESVVRDAAKAADAAAGVAPALRYFDESTSDHIKRLHAALDAKGLARPLYFKSERYTGPTDFAARAVGGKRAMAHDRVYGGKNLEIGLQDTTPGQYVRGLARNIKRKHNWNLVADILHAHAIKGLAPTHGSTISHLRASVHARGIDEGSIAYWNPGVFRRHAERVEADLPDERFANVDESAGIKDALAKSVVRGDQRTDEHLLQTNGWHVVPVETLHELERQSTPSGKVGRSLDIAKGKASRAILLAGNVPWATFQVASNVAMTAAATGGRALNPANWLGTARWWHELSPQERHNVGSHLGLDTSNADLRQVRLGASTNSDLVNTYRAIKAHPLWHTGVAAGHGPTISQLNPMELMAAFDRKQNNAFRKLAGYTLAKQEVVKRMGDEMGHADTAQAKVVSILNMPPADQMKVLARDHTALERHGDRVADWLGDYTTMTAAERRVLNRTFMFYPYLRYSLKLVFYTLPVKHPAVTAILAEMGQLRAEEVKKIFGSDQMFWHLGTIYFDNGHMSIDLKKANPALNALFDAAGAKNPGQMIGMLPPYAGWIADQLTHRSNFADRDWRVNGSAAAYGPKHSDYGFRVRARIALNSVLSLAYPYREAKSQLQPGTQGDDSLLGSPRPTIFKGRTTSSKLKAKFAKRQQKFDEENTSVLTDLVPFIPTPNRDKAAAREQKIIKRSEGPAKAKPKTYFGGTAAGGRSSKPKLFGTK